MAMSKLFYAGLGKTRTWPEFEGATSLSYDDVLIMPRNSSVVSRADVDTSVTFGPYTLQLPVISAPMDTVTGDVMVRTLARLGGIGTLPRGNIDESLELCEVYTKENIPCVYTVGLKNGLEQAKQLHERGAKIILVDVANGGQESVKKLVQKIKEKLEVMLIAGNIATYEQAEDYKKYGVDIARVGIGPGGLCTTRIKTGIGIPQLTAVLETVATGIQVIADGGIKNPGDVAKALAAGAKIVMIGSMFAGTDEAPGEVEIVDRKPMKQVRGQASAEYMRDNNIPLADHRTAEGIATLVQTVGSVVPILQDISGGLRSSMSYVGAQNLSEYYEHALFNRISGSTQRENLPHIVTDRN